MKGILGLCAMTLMFSMGIEMGLRTKAECEKPAGTDVDIGLYLANAARPDVDVQSLLTRSEEPIYGGLFSEVLITAKLKIPIYKEKLSNQQVQITSEKERNIIPDDYVDSMIEGTPLDLHVREFWINKST